MAKPILVANWKNYPGSPEEAQNLLSALSRNSALYKKVSFFIAPPYVYLEPVSKKTRKFSKLACQDIFFLQSGTYTGSITSEILKSFGVRLAIIGHSERRALGESNDVVSQKVKNALRAGIAPLVCVGELVRDDEGRYLEYIRDQIKFSLESVKKKEDAKKIIIAYEPVWAIGQKAKGAVTPEELAHAVIFIKKVLNDIFGREVSDAIPVLYGGSVDAKNAEKLYKEGNVRGFLVGRASLDAKQFAGIVSSIA